MDSKEYFKKEYAKNPKLRKIRYDNQWNSKSMTSLAVLKLRLSSSLTQVQLAKKTKLFQSHLARAESSGCSLDILNKIAKSVGKKIELRIVEPASQHIEQ